MTLGEWVVYWRERLPLKNGYIDFPPRRPKRMSHSAAVLYYGEKLEMAWRKSKRICYGAEVAEVKEQRTVSCRS
ncbi:MAG: hypothetical protein L3J42_00970 [Hydrogenimonas sp.]|nr:hypothetical protein [Hydrogenimonas sp.]